MAGRITSNGTKFLSTLSLRRATFSLLCRILFRRYFYPRSPCGERPAEPETAPSAYVISIHALLAESDPGKISSVLPGLAFLSTLSLRRATWVLRKVPILSIFLSTLSLRRATAINGSNPDIEGFLSTLSLRRATFCRRHTQKLIYQFLSTLSLRRATSMAQVC